MLPFLHLTLDAHTLTNLDHAGLLVGLAIDLKQAVKTDPHHAEGCSGFSADHRIPQRQVAFSHQSCSNGLPRSHLIGLPLKGDLNCLGNIRRWLEHQTSVVFDRTESSRPGNCCESKPD